MKTISAPLVPQLDELQNVDDICAMLDTHGTRGHIDEINWPEYPYAPLATFTIAHTEKTLYIDFFSRGNYLRAENFANQSAVSDDSCVEFFVSPTHDNHYWNFEFNCVGAINASHRSERKNPTRLNADELARVVRYASCGKRPFREVEGMFAWDLLVAIPLDLMGVKYEGSAVKLAANFYKVAAASSAPHFLTWNPVASEKPDFHRPECFGKLILE
jgi:hypothetical protein